MVKVPLVMKGWLNVFHISMRVPVLHAPRNPSWHLTRPSRHCCNRGVSRAGSLSLGRSASSYEHHKQKDHLDLGSPRVTHGVVAAQLSARSGAWAAHTPSVLARADHFRCRRDPGALRLLGRTHSLLALLAAMHRGVRLAVVPLLGAAESLSSSKPMTPNYRDPLDAGSEICFQIWRRWPGASEHGC